MLTKEIFQSLRENKNRIAQGNNALTYSDFCKKVDLLKEEVAHLPQKTSVLIVGKNPINLLAYTIAALDSGLSPAPIVSNISDKLLSQFCEQLSPSSLIFSDSGTMNTSPSPLIIPEDGPFLIFRSSGTTGRPKWIFKHNEEVYQNCLLGLKLQNIAPSDHVLCPLPLSHVGGLCIPTIPALIAGASLTFLERWSPLPFFSDNFKFTHTVLVPSQIKQIIKREQHLNHLSKLSSLKTLITGSTRVDDQILQWADTTHVNIISVYGATEMGPFALVNDKKMKSLNNSSCLGLPLPSVKIQTKEKCIYLKGPGGAHYVLADDELKNIHNQSGWITIDDLVHYDDINNNFYYAGRSGRSFISRGLIINPEEIEDTIERYEGINNVLIVAVPHQVKENILHAYIEAERRIDESELRVFLQEYLEPHKVPEQFIFVDKIELTSIYKKKVIKT